MVLQRGYRLIWILLLVSGSAFAQTLSQKHYGVAEGLPSSTIYTIAQDLDGFMWFGTEAGLTRFDGTEFKTYTTKDGLLDNDVISLCEDSTGRLWITAYKKGICFIYKGKIHSFKNDSLFRAMPSSADEDLTIALPGRKNRCWLYSKNLIRVSGNQVSVFPEINANMCLRWVEDVSDTEFIAYTMNKIFWYKNDLLVDSFNLASLFKLDNLTSFAKDGNLLYVADQGQLHILSMHDGLHVDLVQTMPLKGRVFNQSNKQTDNLIKLNNKVFISAMNLGTYMMDLPLSQPSNISFIPNHSTSLYKDIDNNVWIATSDNGIFKCHTNYFTTFDHNNGLENENTGCIFVDSSSTIWVGDAKGAIQSIVAGKVTDVVADRDNRAFIRSRRIIRKGNFIYFVSDAGYWVYDLVKHQYTKTPTVSSPKSMILSERRNQIIVGTSSSITFSDQSPPFSSKEHYPSKRITAVCEDNDGLLYLGSVDGLYIWTDTLHFIGHTNALLQNRITALALAPKDNILWIGTSSNGVVGYKDGKVIGNINYQGNHSFTGAICRSLFVDDNNHLWVATNNGLNKIDYTYTPQGLKVNNIVPFFTSDGLADDDVNDVYVKDSMAYAATSKGVSVFNYHKVASVSPPPVFITSVVIGQRDTLVEPYYTLPYPQNNITIRYTGLSFANNGNLVYRYKLKDNDGYWTYTDARQVELWSLHYGKYTFTVEALDKFGNPSLHPAQIVFEIKPPFYATWWFWLLTISFFGFAIYAVTGWWFLRKQKNENSLNVLKEKIVRLEQKALRAQMNPHFIFNSLTTIQYFINSEEAETANKYLTSFAKLIRKTLENSSENTITVEKEIQYLDNYIQLEQMRFNNKFSYSITCASGILKSQTYIPVMLTQPYIENAIRHGLRYKEGDEAKLSVHFSMNGNWLLCEIDDNGIGRDMSAKLKSDTHIEYQSKGMKISKDRIEALNNMKGPKIKLEIIDKKTISGVSEGTRVILSFEQNIST